MSLFDVLNQSGLKSTLDTLSSKAGNMASTLSSQTPGGVGGLLGAGALGALLGSFVSKSVLKDAALVGAGAVIWNFYQKWSAGSGTPAQAPAASAGKDDAVMNDRTAMLMLRAMVYAARADGHIDAAEQGRILKLVEQLFPGKDMTAVMNGLMAEPINPDVLVREICAPEQGEDIYRLSCFIVDVDHFMEKSYLEALASALHITPERKGALELEAVQAKQKLIAG